nr:MAG TPA: hypothetical protein [Caudoviricetes sp.]
MNRNNRTRQKCRILRKDYDSFIRFLFNTLSEEDKEFISNRMKEILYEQKKTNETKIN